MLEVWKSICDFEGFYEISNLGNVRSVERLVHKSNGRHAIFKSNPLKPTMGAGYFRVVLSMEGFKRTLSIHRLIAIAFIPNPKKLSCINHKNGIKTDNSLGNLEWCSYSENTKHAFKTGLLTSGLKGKTGESHPTSKLKSKEVVIIKDLINAGQTLISIAKRFNISDKAISDIKIGRTWRSINAPTP